ncbi:hypothetical protein Tco_1307573 [Tanacetum coccineum]
MLAKSSVEAEYKEMNTVTYDVIWIQKILSELKIRISLPVPIDCVVKTVKVKSTDNVANIFTKAATELKINLREGIGLEALKSRGSETTGSQRNIRSISNDLFE